MAVVLLVLAVVAFYYFAAATDVGPAACRQAGGCGFHGNLRPISYATGLCIIGFVGYFFKVNYDATSRLSLTVSLSMLQVFTVFLAVALVILYIFRQKREDVSHRRYW